jgi:Ca-activated chloride channel homolog
MRVEMEQHRSSIKTIGRVSDWRGGNTDQLINAVQNAVVAPTEKIVVRKVVPGKLKIEGADLQGHEVIDVASGQAMGKISTVQTILELPAGLYNVTFGKRLWKSVEVEAGETTILRPGVLQVQHAGIKSHEIRDSETDEVMGSVSSVKNTITLIPGVYDVGFGDIVWPLVKVDGGIKTVLNPGTIQVKGASGKGHIVRTANGEKVGVVSATASVMPLPPGAYTVEVDDRLTPFEITEGKQVVIEARQ